MAGRDDREVRIGLVIDPGMSQQQIRVFANEVDRLAAAYADVAREAGLAAGASQRIQVAMPWERHTDRNNRTYWRNPARPMDPPRYGPQPEAIYLGQANLAWNPQAAVNRAINTSRQVAHSQGLHESHVVRGFRQGAQVRQMANQLRRIGTPDAVAAADMLAAARGGPRTEYEAALAMARETISDHTTDTAIAGAAARATRQTTAAEEARLRARRQDVEAAFADESAGLRADRAIRGAQGTLEQAYMAGIGPGHRGYDRALQGIVGAMNARDAGEYGNVVSELERAAAALEQVAEDTRDATQAQAEAAREEEQVRRAEAAATRAAREREARDEERAKRENKYLGRLGTIAAVHALGGGFKRAAEGMIQGEAGAMGQGAMEVASGGAHAFSRKAFARYATTQSGAALGLGIAGAVVGAVLDLGVQLAKKGDQNTADATARAARMNQAYGMVLQGSPLDVGKGDTYEVSQRAPRGGAAGGSVLGVMTGNATQTAHEISLLFGGGHRRVSAAEREERALHQRRKLMTQYLAGAGMGMRSDEVTSALAALAGSGVGVEQVLGGSVSGLQAALGVLGGGAPDRVTQAIALSRRTGVSTGTLASYIGAAGMGQLTGGNPTDVMSGVIGAANRAGLYGAGADKMLQQFVGMAGQANAVGLGFNAPRELDMLTGMSKAGVSGAGVNKMSNFMLNARVAAKAGMDTGMSDVAMGFAYSLAAQRGAKNDVEINAELAKMTSSDLWQHANTVSPELGKRLASAAGMTPEDTAKAMRADTATNAPLAPVELMRATFGLGEADAKREAWQVEYEESRAQKESMQAFTRVVDEAADAMSRLTKSVNPYYTGRSW